MSVLAPARPYAPPYPRAVDVRAFDRYDMREVGGAGHPFAQPTDLLLTNGLLRVWPGPRRVAPYLNVAARVSGTWREVGVLALADPTSRTDVLGDVRCTSLTPDRASLVLTVANQGRVAVGLGRGERMLRLTHGLAGDPPVARRAAWLGTPPGPGVPVSGASTTPAVFDGGLDLTSGTGALWWPASVPATSWALAFWWTPAAASGTQADSGLGALLNAAGVGHSLRYVASSRTIAWTVGSTTLVSAPLSFVAGQGVCIVARFGPGGRTLTTVVGSAVSHARDSVTDPGVAEFATLALGQTGAALIPVALGAVDLGAGPLGYGISGGSYAGGPVDNAMVFADALSDDEALALGSAATALDHLPQPEGRMVWYAPFDAVPNPAASALAAGMVADAGPDTNGITRGLVARRTGVTAGTGVSLVGTTSLLSLAAVVATADESIATLAAQASESTTQEVLAA